MLGIMLLFPDELKETFKQVALALVRVLCVAAVAVVRLDGGLAAALRERLRHEWAVQPV